MTIILGWLSEFIGKFWPYILVGLVLLTAYLYYRDSEATKLELQNKLTEMTTKNAIQDATINTLKEQSAIIKQVTEEHNARMSAVTKNLEELVKKYQNPNLNKLADATPKLVEQQANEDQKNLLRMIEEHTSGTTTPKPNLLKGNPK